MKGKRWFSCVGRNLRPFGPVKPILPTKPLFLLRSDPFRSSYFQAQENRSQAHQAQQSNTEKQDKAPRKRRTTKC